MIATRGVKPIFCTTSVLAKKWVPDGDYQQTKGIRSEQRITTGKIRGFQRSFLMDYHTKNHARFLILYHMIFICKYRKKLLIHYGNETNKVFEDNAARSAFSFETKEVNKDHIHCLVKSEPKSFPLAIVRRLKQEPTFQLWRMHERALKKQFWKERTFWSDGYFCCTVASVSQETIRKYMESQG
jgi:putative transposase